MKLKRFLLSSALALSFVVTSAQPAKADPVTAAIVTWVGLSGTAATIATFVINAALSTAASWGISKIASSNSKQRATVQERQASVLQLSVGEGPREAAFGHTCTGGSLIDAFNHGGQYGTDYVTRVIALVDHAIDGLYGYYVDDQFSAWGGDGVQAGFDGKLSIEFKNATGEAVVLPAAAAAGGWTSSDELIGVTHVWVTYKFDEKVWPQGHPQFRFSFRGLRVYDPRKDVRFGYGGPNPHVWEDRDTHEITQNAALNRYAFQRGIYAEGHQGEPAYLLIGRGLSEDEAPPERIIAAANVCDEVIAPGVLRYMAAGIIRASDDFVQVEEMFAAAMAGVIVKHEGGIEVEPGQAKAAVVTITDADLVPGEPVSFSSFLTDTDGGRINTVVPRYVSPALNWQDTSGPVRRNLDDITADRGPRELTLPLVLVTVGDQADRCAEIARRLARLERRGSIVLGPEFGHLEEGDWIAWQSDLYLGGATVRFRIENWNLSAEWRNALSIREIASSVFGVPDPIEDTQEPPPAPVPLDALSLPGADAEAITLAGELNVIPAIRFVWDAPVDDAITAIRAEIRVLGETDTAVSRTEAVNSGVLVVSNGVVPQQTLEARLVPIGSPTRPVQPSVWFTVETGDLIAQPGGDLGDTTPPATPTGLTLTSTSTGDTVTQDPVVKIVATWTANGESDLAGYITEITEAGGPALSQPATGNRAEWTGRTGLLYAVRIRAFDGINNVSGWTSWQTVYGAGDTTAPSAPTGLAVTASLGSAFLSWTAPSAADTTAIEVFEATTNSSGAAVSIAVVNAIPGQTGGFTRSGLTSGAVRYYWIKARDSSGNLSAFSSGVSVTVPGVVTGDLDTTPPAVPSGLTLGSSVTNDAAGNPVVRVLATWTANGESDFDHYELEMAEGGGTPFVRITGTNRDEFAGRSGVSYACRLRAVDHIGNRSAWSSTVSTTAAGDTTPPAAPTSLTSSASLGSVILVCAAPSAADTVAVEFYENSTNNSGTAYAIGRATAAPSTVVTWTRGGLPSGTVAYYWAKAVDASGNLSAFSAVSSLTTPRVGVTDFASTLAPVELMTTTERLAAAPILGRVVFDTILAQLFRGTGGAWTSYVEATEINGQITTTQITNNAVTTPLIAAGAVTTARLAAGAVTANEIAANTITAGQIQAGAISATEIAAGAITTDKLGALSVTAGKIAAGTITTDKLSVTGALPVGLTIGVGSATLGDISSYALDPAARINGGTTLVGPGFIRIQGGTTLDAWRDGTEIAGGAIKANTIDTTKLTVGNRQLDVAVVFTVNSPGTNQISWSAGHVAWQNEAGSMSAVAISAGSATWTGSPAWLGIWFLKNNGTLQSGDMATPAANPDAVLLAVYRGGTGLTEIFGRTIIEGDFIRTGTIVTRTIAAEAITATEIAAGAITATKIAAGTITADRIAAGTITGDRFNTSTSLPGSITVGATGVSLGTVENRAANPADVINGGSTKITPGLILVAGSTTLADWRQGGDETRIAGGSLSANTVAANKLTIGNRNLTIIGCEFQWNGSVLSWTSGYVLYQGDAGTGDGIFVNAGSTAWAGGGTNYITWTKGSGTLTVSADDWDTIVANNNKVIFCTWSNGSNFVANYGGTIVHGDKITTGTITANKLSVANLSAITAALGTVTSGKVQNAAGTTFLDLDNSRSQYRRGSYDLRLGTIGSGVALWYGSTSITIGSETRTNGVWAFGDDGVVYYGSTVLTPGSNVVSKICGAGGAIGPLAYHPTYQSDITGIFTVPAGGKFTLDVPGVFAISDVNRAVPTASGELRVVMYHSVDGASAATPWLYCEGDASGSWVPIPASALNVEITNVSAGNVQFQTQIQGFGGNTGSDGLIDAVLKVTYIK